MAHCLSLERTHPLASKGADRYRRRGVAGALVVVTLPVLFGAAALSIDLGYLYLVRQKLQTSADAGAMAAAWTLFEDGNRTPVAAQLSAEHFAALNSPDAVHELTFGWVENPFDPASPFLPVAPDEANALMVTSRRTSTLGNPVDLFFAGVFGRTTSDVSALALVVYAPAASVDGVPVALRAPGFGPIDPDIVDANPGKGGPSEPLDETAFQIGEEVTLFIFGKGKKSPVHLVLNTNDIPGEAQLGKVLRGEQPPVPLAVGDEFDVVGDGTGHNGLGNKLADRLEDDDPNNDVIIVPVVETLSDSRSADGKLDGNVRIVDFVAVRLDAVVTVSVPDPNDPQDNGKTIEIELLVGTIVESVASGAGSATPSGVVEGVRVGVPMLTR